MSTRSVCTVFRVHYRTEFGDFITIRGSNQGMLIKIGEDGDKEGTIKESDGRGEKKVRTVVVLTCFKDSHGT